MAKIKVHNIVSSSGRALLTLHLQPQKAEFLPSILYALREENISIPFIVQSTDRKGNQILSVAIEEENLEWVQAAFKEGLDLSSPLDLKVKKEVALITLYGPHLGEKPGIAKQMLSTLAVDGVELLALSASINSCLMIVSMESLAKSLRSLSRIFEIPAK